MRSRSGSHDIQTWHDIHAHARVDNLDLDAMSQWLGRKGGGGGGGGGIQL